MGRAHWHGKTYYNKKIYNEEVTGNLQFLENQKLIVNHIKKITRKQSDLTIKKLKKKNRQQEWVN